MSRQGSSTNVYSGQMSVWNEWAREAGQSLLIEGKNTCMQKRAFFFFFSPPFWSTSTSASPLKSKNNVEVMSWLPSEPFSWEPPPSPPGSTALKRGQIDLPVFSNLSRKLQVASGREGAVGCRCPWFRQASYCGCAAAASATETKHRRCGEESNGSAYVVREGV